MLFRAAIHTVTISFSQPLPEVNNSGLEVPGTSDGLKTKIVP